MDRRHYCGVIATIFLAGCGIFDAPGEYRHDTVMIRWVEAADHVEQCEGAQACAFPSGVPCVIITAPKPDLVVLGHEVKHCFVGAFHK